MTDESAPKWNGLKRTPLKRNTPMRRGSGPKRSKLSLQKEPTRWDRGGGRSEYAEMRDEVRRRALGFCELNGLHSKNCARDHHQGSQAHHVQPRSHGGIDAVENLLWVHPDCHMELHTKHPEKARELGYLKDSRAMRRE